MKFSEFTFLTAWDWVFILPTIAIQINQPYYCKKNLHISIHFLGWHLRWRWLEE